jgi:hypothetical protein
MTANIARDSSMNFDEEELAEFKLSGLIIAVQKLA